ncbi:uncharacterized protein GGS22DRAFT_129188 [Annulohypoxylon maeteangense]|uniref:uncharacterized protein n=1 Tax=Annulohypoxylon maeteangense TaxID=1927788 RepID=UPI002007DC97|nr:uncharacterized protein GGS22DRAFT_129188 [Annulohypoxylon maeteangense]KAI0885437.1 hypothetical protein GGS22DRAFT_129188 [Annulohypoxylon maeteangense]
MAEALTLIGGLAAIMQLSGTMVNLTGNLRTCVNTIRSAPKEIESFILETSVFTDLLCYFHDITKELADKLDRRFDATRVALIRKITGQCEVVKDGFAHLVARFGEINSAHAAPFNTLWVRILWLWKKPDVPELRLSIQSAIANLLLISNCFKLEEKIRSHGKDGEIKMLQGKLINYASTARKLRCKLAKRQRRKRPSERLPEIDELEDYVIDTIESHTSHPEPPRQGQRKPLFAKIGGKWVEAIMTEDGIRLKRPTSSQSTNERLEKGLSRAQAWVQVV